MITDLNLTLWLELVLLGGGSHKGMKSGARTTTHTKEASHSTNKRGCNAFLLYADRHMQ